MAGRLRITPPGVNDVEPRSLDLTCNVHRFSECPLVAIERWMEELERLGMPDLVPNKPSGFLSTETDGTRLDHLSVIEAHQYHQCEEDGFNDKAVRVFLGLNDRYCLFKLER